MFNIATIPTARDHEIAASVLGRMRLGPEHMPRVLRHSGYASRWSDSGEVHWVYRYHEFEEGGSFWPALPERLEDFVETVRGHSHSVFHGEICESAGIKVDDAAASFETHQINLFAIDLLQWAICPLDEQLYLAKRASRNFLERWFAGFPDPTPSPESLQRLTRALCGSRELPYPGPMVLSDTPLYPQPGASRPPRLTQQALAAWPAAGRVAMPMGPIPQGEAFLKSVAEVRDAWRGKKSRKDVDLWWLGQSAFLLHWNGRCLLLDPFLSSKDPQTQAGNSAPARPTKRVIAPEKLDFIDLVLVSHHEPDHLNASTLRILGRVNPKLVLVCPASLRELARERSRLPAGRIVSIDPHPSASPGYPMQDKLVSVQGFHVIPVIADRRSLAGGDAGRYPPTGFIIERSDFALYHGSHAMLEARAVSELRAWKITVALLPIDGREDDRDVTGNYWGEEAAALAKEMQADLVIPCHYNPSEPEGVTTDEFEWACALIQQEGQVLQQGQRFTFHIDS
jgi:L-ascorbate metabolism protein UlaG (beta-lactamase superfamily)